MYKDEEIAKKVAEKKAVEAAAKAEAEVAATAAEEIVDDNFVATAHPAASSFAELIL
jgi:small subunit ribosomal protein S16